MMKIKSLSPVANAVGKYKVEFSDGQVLTLYRQTIEDFGLYPGMEFSREQLDALIAAAGEMSAKMRAVRIVSAAGVSKRDLRQRLIQKGESPENADNAVAWMEELSLLDDRKTAQMIVSRCADKGYGAARARQSLYEKKIPKELWEEVLEDYPDQSEFILSFLRSKVDNDTDAKQLRRVIDSLLRKGHSYSQIRRCLDRLSLDLEELPED